MLSIQTHSHGAMFHHFHGDTHPQVQGSISAPQFEKILDFYGDRLIGAHEWTEKFHNNTLSNKDVCITLDDALQCQFDIALPVLEQRNLTAFWFVYSSVVTGGIEMLEVYKKYRDSSFSSIDLFYEHFYKCADSSNYAHEINKAKETNKAKTHLSQWDFYSESDRVFRYVRDHILGVESYFNIMNLMLKNDGIVVEEYSKGLWMNADNVKTLHEKKHIIGLHSHTHPTQISHLNKSLQEQEYQTNQHILEEILGEKPSVMSHPCNSYNSDTIALLKDLNITLGFRSNMALENYTSLEIPREDHANLLKLLSK